MDTAQLNEQKVLLDNMMGVLQKILSKVSEGEISFLGDYSI